jgi:tRNA pseudouridine55 synthase
VNEAGILRVDKPEGPTSHDVVDMVRRALSERRIGHTGTLDPFASGLLLVCVGRGATRLAPLLTGLAKRYHAVARLGEETTTDDRTGDVTLRNGLDGITPARVAAALESMTGPSLQTPPAFSAKKVDGRRAYQSARAGVAVDLKPVPITILEMRVLDVRLPDVEFLVQCSSGTYIRAIARDLGRMLGVGGHLRSLRRTGIGAHDVEGAITLAALTDAAAVQSAWMTPLDAMAHLPLVRVGDDDVARIMHGMSVAAPADLDAGQVAVASGDRLVAIAQVDGAMILPKKVFA